MEFISAALIAGPFTGREHEKVRKYRRQQQCILFFFMAYVAAGLVTVFATKNAEVFPFFNGHWFHLAPNRMHDYGIWIESIDGHDLGRSGYFETVAAEYFPDVKRFNAYGTIQKFGQALAQKTPESASLRAYFENMIGADRAIRYEVHERDYVTTEMAFSGAVKSFRSLGQFSSRAQTR